MHTKMDGMRCGNVALLDKSYCRFHDRYYARNAVTEFEYDPPVFEDARSVLLAIHELVRARAGGQIDNRDMKAYMYAYQVAAGLAAQVEDADRKMWARAAKADRKKQQGKTFTPEELERRRLGRDPNDDRNFLEFMLDWSHDHLEGLRAKEAEKAGLPKPEPRPRDRLRTLQEMVAHSPNQREILEAMLDDTCRRYPEE